MNEEQFSRIAGLVDWKVPAGKLIAILGLGAMGNPAAIHLAEHGAGALGNVVICDGDVVEPPNFPRTNYNWAFDGMRKVDATARQIGHEWGVQGKALDDLVLRWDQYLEEDDIPEVQNLASHLDLLMLALDSDVGRLISEACYDICPILYGIFGERCDYAEIAFSVPRETTPIHEVLFGTARPELETIDGAQALGFDTKTVSIHFAKVAYQLLLNGARGSDLLPSVFSNAPLHVVALRPTGVFKNMPQDMVTAVHIVGMPDEVGFS